MLWTLTRREILSNLMTFRFFVAVIACLSLVLASTIVLTNDYAQRLVRYNADVIKHRQSNFSAETYSYFTPELDKPPNPLSIFNQGLEKHTASRVQILRGEVPYLWKSHRNADYDNPFQRLLTELDIVSIFQILLSLLALVFAYDAIAGEREAGTLRLMLANSVSRGLILFSKYMGAMVCLLLPFLLSFLFALVLQRLSGVTHYTLDDFVRIGGIFVTSLVSVSTFYLIGLLISSATRHTATSLICSIFVWIAFTFIYPNVSLFMVNRLVDIEEKLEQANREIDQIWKQFYREVEKRRDPLEGARCSRWHGGTNDSRNCSYIPPEFASEIPAAKAYYQFLAPFRIRTGEKIWSVRKQVFVETYTRKYTVARNTLRFSPTGLYQLTTEAWAGTGLFRAEDFFTQARQYRQTVLDYLYDKKAFGSRLWFASDRGKVSWDDMQRFSYRPPSVLDDASRALSDLLILFILNPLLFMITFTVFSREEV